MASSNGIVGKLISTMEQASLIDQRFAKNLHEESKHAVIPQLLDAGVDAALIAQQVAKLTNLPLLEMVDDDCLVDAKNKCIIKDATCYTSNVFDAVAIQKIAATHDIKHWGVLSSEYNFSSQDAVYDTITDEDSRLYLVKVLNEALNLEASDVHIEPDHKAVTVKVRIDGALKELTNLAIEHDSYPALANCILNKADCTPGEYISPKDGEFTHEYNSKKIQIRMSMVPSAVERSKISTLNYPGTFVLRLAGQNRQLQNIDALGFSPRQLQDFGGALRSPHGLIVVTGPTGSGKTTTLYAALRYLQNVRENWSFRTVEDPVEVNLQGITQTQVNESAQVTFANVLRSMLRQDPDVIMVGEIRDKDTMLVALEAAMTGHLVICTLHANSAIQAIHRLVMKGADADLLADVLVASTAQRVTPKLCDNCKVKIDVEDSNCSAYEKGILLQKNLNSFYTKGEGCQECDGGFKGRVLIAEILLFDAELKELVAQNTTTTAIEKACASSFQDMWYRALDLIKEGAIDFESAEFALGKLSL